MKAEIVVNTKTKEIEVPCLMANPRIGILDLIIFANKINQKDNTFEGMVIYDRQGSGHKLGEYSKTWSLHAFRIFTGELQLSN